MGVLSSRSRKLGFVVACLVSVLIGAALVFFLVQPRRVSLVRTAELYGVLAMLVLPGFAAWANRRVRQDAPVVVAPQPIVLSLPDPTPATPARTGVTRAAQDRRVPPSGESTNRAKAQAKPADSPRSDVIVIPAELLRPYYGKQTRTHLRPRARSLT